MEEGRGAAVERSVTNLRLFFREVKEACKSILQTWTWGLVQSGSR